MENDDKKNHYGLSRYDCLLPEQLVDDLNEALKRHQNYIMHFGHILALQSVLNEQLRRYILDAEKIKNTLQHDKERRPLSV